MNGTILLKHQMSELRDLGIRYEVDKSKNEVTLTVGHFDSNLIAEFVCRSLEELTGALAHQDDNVKDRNWRSAKAPYSLFIVLAGLRYKANVVKLASYSAGSPRAVTVVLEPLEPMEPTA